MISTQENAGGHAATLAEIEVLTKHYADEHHYLACLVQDMEDEFAKTKRKYMTALRDGVAKSARAKLMLHSAIQGSPKLFEKPRTHIFHGVKVGFQKQKGSIEYADEEKTLALIHKVFGDDAAAYIRTTEKPDLKMIGEMPANELKKIGCTITNDTDQVVIKPTDSAIEKTVAALLKDATEPVAA